MRSKRKNRNGTHGTVISSMFGAYPRTVPRIDRIVNGTEEMPSGEEVGCFFLLPFLHVQAVASRKAVGRRSTTGVRCAIDSETTIAARLEMPIYSKFRH